MPELILHAGVPKTGTGSIQKTLSKYTWDDLLNEQGIHYLKHHSISVNHSKYFHSLCGRPEWAGPARHIQNVTLFTEALDAARGNTRHNNAILISAEAISPIANDYGRLALAGDFVSRFSSDITIIVYIREPLSYMCSRIQQGLKAAQPLGSMVKNAVASADYTTLLRNLRHMFGSSNVTIRSFDPAMLLDGDVVTDFCLGALGMPDSSKLRCRIGERVEDNRSLPSEFMELLVSLYENKSISPATRCTAFSRSIRSIQWAGTKFGITFFPEDIRLRILAAADKERERIRDYLGYDCFPSYRPVETNTLKQRSIQEETRTFRQNIDILTKVLYEYGCAHYIQDIRLADDLVGKHIETRDDAKLEAYRLLDHFYELCRNANA